MNIDFSNNIILNEIATKAKASPEQGTVSGDNSVFSKLVMQGLQKGSVKSGGTNTKGEMTREMNAGPAETQATDVGQELEAQKMSDLLAMYAAHAANGGQADLQLVNLLAQAMPGATASGANAFQETVRTNLSGIQPMTQLTNPQRFISFVNTQANENAAQTMPGATGSGANVFRETVKANLSGTQPVTSESVEANSKTVISANSEIYMKAASSNAVTGLNENPGNKAANTVAAGNKQASVNIPQTQGVSGRHTEHLQADEKSQDSTATVSERQAMQEQQGAAAMKTIDIEGSAQVKEPMQSAETPRTELYNQVAKAVTENLNSKGPMEFKLQLQPENMGLIDIKLSIEGGKLTIDILAANAKTHMLLAGQTDKLIQGLGLQNVQVENVQVGHNAADMGGQGQNQSGSMNDSADLFHKNRHNEFVNHDGSNSGYGEQNLPDEDAEIANAAFVTQGMYRLNYAV